MPGCLLFPPESPALPLFGSVSPCRKLHLTLLRSPFPLRLQLADVAINATADAVDSRYTKTDTILVLVAQLATRICCSISMVGLLASSRTWSDEFLLQYCGIFVVSLVGLIVCAFLRVYRVTIASFPSRYTSVLEYWALGEYVIMFVGNTLLSLVFYYYSITSAFRMGSARTHLGVVPEVESSGRSAPSIFQAIQESSRRRN